MSIRMTLTLFIASVALPFGAAAQENGGDAAAPAAKHVIVIGIDGLSPDGIAQADTPNIDALAARGSSSMRARGVMPTSSAPNWASILSGAGPEEHGITANSYDRDAPSLPPVVSGANRFKQFPNMFEILRTRRSDATLATIYHWGSFGQLFDSELLDHTSNPEEQAEVIDEAIDYFASAKPMLLFLHLDDVDGAGHSFGHGSPEYYRSVEVVDALVGELMAGVERSGIADDTVIILTADHGGKGFGHNESTPPVITVPVVIAGAGIRQGHAIQEPVSLTDIAPTVLAALGVEAPSVWTGEAISSAFANRPLERPEYLPTRFIPAPEILPAGSGFMPSGGVYRASSVEVAFGPMQLPGLTMHYTLDGSDPEADSPVYEGPFSLDRSAIVKARAFAEDGESGPVEVGYFRLVPEDPSRGIRTEFFYGDGLEKVPNINGLTGAQPDASVLEFTTDKLFPVNGFDQLVLRMTSRFEVTEAGEYTFYLISDDGSNFYLNDTKLIDNDGNHGMRERTATVELQPGFHDLRVEWYNGGGGYGLYLLFSGPGMPKQFLSADRLFFPEE